MQSHQSYSYIPEEIIIFDILSRAPAKSVGLCRCVSKSWRSLLSQPNFIKTHLQFTKINSVESLLIHTVSGPTPNHTSESTIYSAPLNNAHHLFVTKLCFDGYSPHPAYRIYGSCDGLLFVGDVHKLLSVINPVTEEITQVPPSPLVGAHTDALYWYAFHYGFGYDSVCDDYKIVIISYILGTKENFVDVYSLKIGSWKRLEGSPCDYYGFVGYRTIDQGAFVGGCLYWLARRTIDDKIVIMAFNLVDEKFLEIRSPDLILFDEGHIYNLGVLGGFLCIYLHDHGWVMKEDGVPESWTKFTMNIPHGRVAWFQCVLNSQEQVVIETNHNHSNHFMWNPKQGTWKKIVFNGINGHSNIFIHVKASFVESLISPYGIHKSETARKFS